MTSHLASRECVPCKGGVPPLREEELEAFSRQLDSGLQVVREHHLEKDYSFSTYRDAVEFVNRVAAIAEEQNHHPDILLGWRKVKVAVWTHKIDGLTESDFIFAAKAEAAYTAPLAITGR